jgi:hypothetical protein
MDLVAVDPKRTRDKHAQRILVFGNQDSGHSDHRSLLFIWGANHQTFLVDE